MSRTIQPVDIFRKVVEWVAHHTNCYATFNRWNDKRNVNVNRNDDKWNDNWWFPCRRNSLHF